MNRRPLLLIAAMLLSACGHVHLRNSVDIALYQSDEQRLIVTNTTLKPLTIGGRSGAAPVDLAPGGSMTIPFRIATIGTAKPPSGEPYWTIDPAGYTEAFQELGAAKFVDTSSPALTLRFHDPHGALVAASFSLSSCRVAHAWAQPHLPSAEHRIQVPDPVPAVPQPVCPEG